jgi:flagellar secretion chaperone FliS
MSYLDARSQYRRAADNALPETATPHQIVAITLRELHKSLTVLAAAQRDGQRYPNAHVTKAMTAIYVLQSSLDFEQGGEIATNLFQVYEFTRLQLVAAFQREREVQISQALSYIGDILSAWQSMPGAA